MASLRPVAGFAERVLRNTRPAAHSGLMLATRIILAHFSVSAASSFPKFVGRHWHRRTAEFGKTRLQPGQDGVHCPVQRVDDFRWRAFRCHDSIPNAASL